MSVLMSAPALEFPTLWKVIDRLDKAGIEYMLTGSLALNFYGHIRATNDIDIVIQVGPTDASRIYQLFREDCYINEDSVTKAIAQKGLFNIIDNEDVFKVDFIVAKDNAYANIQFERRHKINIDEKRVLCVIAPEDLIISKLEWSQKSLSEMQENDIRNILKISADSLDKLYLDTWAERQGVKERLEQIYETL